MTAIDMTARKPAIVSAIGTSTRLAPESPSFLAEGRGALCPRGELRGEEAPEGCVTGYSRQSLLTPAGALLVGSGFFPGLLAAPAGGTASKGSAKHTRTLLVAAIDRARAADIKEPEGDNSAIPPRTRTDAAVFADWI
jgi:hypothetical protein